MYLFTEKGKNELKKSLSKYDILFFNSTNSTQLEIEKVYKKEGYKKVIAIANEQSKGKGRYGREWISFPNVNIYLSLLYENYYKKDIPILNLFCGIVVYESLLNLFPVLKHKLTLKWPNDIYIKDKKLGGILIQSLDLEMKYVVIGIGINVYASKKDIPEIGTSLKLELSEKELKNNARIRIIDRLIKRFEILDKKDDIIEKFYIYSKLTQENFYIYSSSYYSYEGKLYKVDSNGTAYIKLKDDSIIHLNT